MKGRFISAFLLVCGTGVIACDTRDQVVDPTPLPPPPPTIPGESQFASVRLTPAIVSLEEGDTVRLKAVPVDFKGSDLQVPHTVTYGSHAPSVATVSETGLMTARAGGYTDISATVVIGTTTRGVTRRTYVFSAVSPDSIVLTSGKNGWDPAQAQVSPGGTVEWRIGEVDWAGLPVKHIYLMDQRYSIVDSVDVRTGSATRRFDSRGFVSYCSGACWDPPDWGVIYVR
jgi:hypothetical protein